MHSYEAILISYKQVKMRYSLPYAYAVFCVEGDPMVLPHPRDVILYARSSYYYDMFIIYFFRHYFDFITCFGLNTRKNCGNVCH